MNSELNFGEMIGGGGSNANLDNVVAQFFTGGTTYTFTDDYENVLVYDHTKSALDLLGTYFTLNGVQLDQATDVETGYIKHDTTVYTVYANLHDVKSGDVLTCTSPSFYTTMFFYK